MVTLKEKADHVRAQRVSPQRASDHKCHWVGCDKDVPPALWGCAKHWYALPRALRAKIWATYRPGQEDDKSPSADYIKVAKSVRLWILDYQGRGAQKEN